MVLGSFSGDFFEDVARCVRRGAVVKFGDCRKPVWPEFFESWRGVSVETFVVFEHLGIVEGVVEDAEMIVGTAEGAVFPTIEVADFVVRILFAECAYEFGYVGGSERVIRRDIVTVFKLFGSACVLVAIGESKPRIAMLIEIHAGFVDDANCPHESVIDATTKALTASHLQRFMAFRFVEGETARYLIAVTL